MTNPPLGIADHIGGWLSGVICAVLMIVGLFQPITDLWIVVGIFISMWIFISYLKWV